MAGVLVLLAAGCGGQQHPAPTATTVAHPGPPPRRIQVTVLDGDTGKPVTEARVSAPGAHARGSVLVTRIRTRPLLLTGAAPGYGTVTSRLAPGVKRITLSLYRPAGQWLLYGASANRAQYQPGIRLRPPFRVVWGRNLGTLLEFPAVVDDGVAYLSNLHGQLFALSMSDGKVVWHVDMHTREEDSSPAVVGRELVAHVKAGRVLVLDRATGRILWSREVSGEVESSPVIAGGIDYLGDWAGDVYALDLKTRKLRWTYHDGCKITASVAISGSALYLGDYCGRVLALDRANGRLLWTASAGSPVYGTSAVVGGRVFVPSRDAGALYAFTTSGQYLWRVSTGGLVYSAPAVWKGRVYFGSYTGRLYCVSAKTGAVLWTLDTGGEISGSPTVIDGVVYAGTFSHRIVGADARTGRQLFSFPHGEYVAVSGNAGRLLLYGWASVWAVEPRS